jgi:hypothetical protein
MFRFRAHVNAATLTHVLKRCWIFSRNRFRAHDRHSGSGDLGGRLLNSLLVFQTQRQEVAPRAPHAGPLVEPAGLDLARDVTSLGEMYRSPAVNCHRRPPDRRPPASTSSGMQTISAKCCFPIFGFDLVEQGAALPRGRIFDSEERCAVLWF